MSKIKSFQISNSLTQGIEETISAGQNYSGQLRIEVLPIKKIELDPENPREMSIDFLDIAGLNKNDPLYEKKRVDIERLRSMAESIKKEGVLNPIIVYKFGEKYRLVAGERRTLASILAEKGEIQARILEKKPIESKKVLLQWIENVERENLTLWERLTNLEKIIIAHKEETIPSKEMTPTALSQIIGCSLPYAMHYCNVINADKSIKNAIKENKIKNLEKASTLAQIKNTQIREMAIDVCIAGATLKKLKDIIVELNNKERNNMLKSNVQAKGKRGRQALRVNLGTTKKTAAVKFIVNLVLQGIKYSHLKPIFVNLNWNEYGEVTKAFQQVLQAIEKQEQE